MGKNRLENEIFTKEKNQFKIIKTRLFLLVKFIITKSVDAIWVILNLRLTKAKLFMMTIFYAKHLNLSSTLHNIMYGTRKYCTENIWFLNIMNSNDVLKLRVSKFVISVRNTSNTQYYICSNAITIKQIRIAI